VKNFLFFDPDLRELLCDYLKNRHKEVKAVDTALKDAILAKTRIPDLQSKVRRAGRGLFASV
jgi:hypothetical protein